MFKSIGNFYLDYYCAFFTKIEKKNRKIQKVGAKYEEVLYNIFVTNS